MDSAALGRRFLESTRGQIVSLLRRGDHTVDELAAALGLTDNAVRNHLSALERDGLIRAAGVRRGGGAGKPAVVYELHPDAAPVLSKAYPPVLSSLMDAVVTELPPEQVDAVLRAVGRSLAASVGGRARGELPERVQAAAEVLNALGGDVEVLRGERVSQIQGSGCPLATVVRHRPEMCRAVEAMIEEVVGAPVRTCCQHGPKPRCCFDIDSAA